MFLPSSPHLSSTSGQPLPFVGNYHLSLRLFYPNMQKPGSQKAPDAQHNKFCVFCFMFSNAQHNKFCVLCFLMSDLWVLLYDF